MTENEWNPLLYVRIGLPDPRIPIPVKPKRTSPKSNGTDGFETKDWEVLFLDGHTETITNLKAFAEEQLKKVKKSEGSIYHFYRPSESLLKRYGIKSIIKVENNE